MLREGIKLVLDTNIIISAVISTDGNPACIFEFFLEGKVVNYTNEEIIKELEEVMERPFFKEAIDDNYKRFILDNFKRLSLVIRPIFNEKVVLKDDKFINCAISVKVGIIISGNKHLLELKDYKGISILDARSFLERFTAFFKI